MCHCLKAFSVLIHKKWWDTDLTGVRSFTIIAEGLNTIDKRFLKLIAKLISNPICFLKSVCQIFLHLAAVWFWEKRERRHYCFENHRDSPEGKSAPRTLSSYLEEGQDLEDISRINMTRVRNRRTLLHFRMSFSNFPGSIRLPLIPNPNFDRTCRTACREQQRKHSAQESAR